MSTVKFYDSLKSYMSGLEAEFMEIPADRKLQLLELGEYLKEKHKAGKGIKVTVICTHNSRRSHMGQLWLLAAARYYGLENVRTYSGGTEATAFHPNAVKAMRDAGFKLVSSGENDNPEYTGSMGPDFPPEKLFSKKFDHPGNPQNDFAAVMVCSEADAACPIVPGADARFALPSEDPKAYDNTIREKLAYAERCRQIARECFFAVKSAL